MDNCTLNHHLLPESFIVQPIENIPMSVIDYDKIEMTEFIPSAQLTAAAPVIQLTDFNSNLKGKALHPLEIEIQKDFELKKQQQILAKHPVTSVIQCTSHLGQDICIDKPSKIFETPTPEFDGVVQLQTLPNIKETVVNVNTSKTSENMFCHISQINGSLATEKRQFIIVSDSSLLFNLAPKEEKIIEPKQMFESVINNQFLDKPEAQDVSLILNNTNKTIVECKKGNAESDSENEEDTIEPVHDYEPDPPDVATKINLEQAEKPNKCYMCFKSFRHKKNMYAHIRQIHSIQPKIEGGILCPLCKMHALRQEHLRNHLKTLHEISIEKEEKLFNTMEEFLSWKETIERETLSLYVSKSSSKLLANNQQKTYYKCHRSGSYITHKKENRKKKLKVQGSNKIGATCPAAMEVTENVQGINVIFWKTHVGHENDLAHLVLSKEDKAKIMDYLISGISWDKILEKIKKEETKSSSTPSRLTILSKQDLRNIKKIHDMKNASESFGTKKNNIQCRKPIKEMLRRASQSLIIEKVHVLLNLLETTDIRPEFRPKVCLMIDNLISTVKRRANKLPKREIQKRKQWMGFESVEDEEQLFINKLESNSNNESTVEGTLVNDDFEESAKKENSTESIPAGNLLLMESDEKKIRDNRYK